MTISRRGFLKSLGVAVLGFAIDPASNLLIPEPAPEPRKKIWVVGALLERPRFDVKAVNFGLGYGAPLAMSMVQPLRRRLDYAAISREVFRIEPLPDGALPIHLSEELPDGRIVPLRAKRPEGLQPLVVRGSSWPSRS